MKIVIDTNVVISALFFKGKPFEVLNMAVNRSDGINAFATPDIVSEYIEIFQRMIDKKGKKKPEDDPLLHFVKYENLTMRQLGEKGEILKKDTLDVTSFQGL